MNPFALEPEERDAGDWVCSGLIFFGILTGAAGIITLSMLVSFTALAMISIAALWFYIREGI